MKDKVVVKDGVVVNRAAAPSADWAPAEPHDAVIDVETDDPVGPDWLWDGESFSRPPDENAG